MITIIFLVLLLRKKGAINEKNKIFYFNTINGLLKDSEINLDSEINCKYNQENTFSALKIDKKFSRSCFNFALFDDQNNCSIFNSILNTIEIIELNENSISNISDSIDENDSFLVYQDECDKNIPNKCIK